MALKHGIRGNVTPIMNNVYTRMQEPQILLFRSALAACFSFVVGSPEAWLKLGSLRHTCGLDVQRAKNIHPLFLTHTNILQFFASTQTDVCRLLPDLD